MKKLLNVRLLSNASVCLILSFSGFLLASSPSTKKQAISQKAGRSSLNTATLLSSCSKEFDAAILPAATISGHANTGNDKSTSAEQNIAIIQQLASAAYNNLSLQEKSILQAFNISPQKLDLDIMPDNLSSQQQAFRAWLVYVGPSELNLLFQNLPKKSFKKLVQLAKAAGLKKNEFPLSEQQQLLLMAFAGFADKDRQSVFVNKDKVWNTLVSYYPDYNSPAYLPSLGGVIGGVDTSTITALENEIMQAARGDKYARFTSGSFLQRRIKPTYFVTKSIIQFHNQVRERLEYVEQLRLAFYKEVAEELALVGNWSPNEYESLQKINRSIEAIRKEVIEDLDKAYEQPMFSGGWIRIPEKADIYHLAKQIETHKLLQNELSPKFALQAESALLNLDSVFQDARKRTGSIKRQEVDMDLAELRIRHRQYARTSLNSLTAWQTIMNKKTSQSIYLQYHWYDTVTDVRIVPGPNNTTRTEVTTRQVRKSDSGNFAMSYSQILDENLSEFYEGNDISINNRTVTLDSVSGVEKISKLSQKMRDLESKYYQLEELQVEIAKYIDQHSFLLLKQRTNAKEYNTVLLQLEKYIVQIRQYIEGLEKHTSMSEVEVKTIWPQDNYQNFLDRNHALIEAQKQLLEYYENYHEQLRRLEAKLQIEAVVYDHTKPMRRLFYSMLLNYSILSSGVVGSSITAPYIYMNEDVQQEIVEQLKTIKKEIQNALPSGKTREQEIFGD